MDISLLDREQLKDIIRANDWDDKPSLKVSEKAMEDYLQAKIDAGELTLDNNVEPINNENSEGETLASAVQSAADDVEKEADPEVVEEPKETASSTDGERIVNVSILRPVFVEEQKKTMPEFDEDGIATVKADVPISMAKAWAKVGACHING
jgi:hypothetical protein